MTDADVTRLASLVSDLQDRMRRMEGRLSHDFTLRQIPDQQAVAAAVRAQLARFEVERGDLGQILGLSRPTVSARYHGHAPYTAVELERLATHLGVTHYEVLELAAYFANAEDRTEALPLPEPDIFAQPPRALSAARRKRREGH